MKYIICTIFMVCLLTITIFSQEYWWVRNQSGSSLGGPIDYMTNNTDIVYYGSDNKIYKSVDRGETFSQTGINVPGSSEIKNIILDDFNPGTFLVAIESSPNDKIYKTTDDGQSWVLTLNEGQMSFFGIPMTPDPSNPNSIYTMVNTNFKHSTDFGDTWTTIASNFGPQGPPCDIEVFPNSDVILIGDNFTGIYKSTDKGLTWAAKYNTSGEIPTISVSITNPGVAWATKWSGGGGLLKSTDYGETWALQPGFTGINMWGVHIQPTDGNIIIVNSYSTAPGSWRSIDAGLTWTAINIPSQGYQVVSVDSMTQFAAQGNGFYKLYSDLFIPVELTSFSAEASENEIVLNWTTATELNNQGFEIERRSAESQYITIGYIDGYGTTTEPREYTFIDNLSLTGTFFYRLKQIDFGGMYEYSDEIEVDVIGPISFILEQNYPNPFNPSTSIKFSIPVDSNVKLKLFNILGQEVAELLNSEIAAGIHHVDFNASSLSSGTYFYVLEAIGNNGSTFTDTRKMILLR
ncbi:MAG: T9SS type A sorting domain-containing protein [Bacteroidetes bacterium]|nr:T9SS type A sorting domain-containing protein [Bacteroidota bacterium]